MKYFIVGFILRMPVSVSEILEIARWLVPSTFAMWSSAPNCLEQINSNDEWVIANEKPTSAISFWATVGHPVSLQLAD